MSIWILTVWLVLANGSLEVTSQTEFTNKDACLAATAEIEMPEGASWIASCKAKDRVPVLD